MLLLALWGLHLLLLLLMMWMVVGLRDGKGVEGGRGMGQGEVQCACLHDFILTIFQELHRGDHGLRALQLMHEAHQAREREEQEVGGSAAFDN